MNKLLLLISLMAGSLVAALPSSADPGPVLRLATTTSTDNSGLLTHLLPPFEKSTGLSVHVIAVGTGKALRIAQNGDVDVVMVHAPPAEERFVAAGHGVDRRQFMYNDFVIVGPDEDPAGIASAESAFDALRRIARTRSRFVSRGDDSGTHKKELSLWQHADVEAEADWYVISGMGMGKVLLMAGELGAYTLTDRGTWLAFRGRLPLALLFQNDPPLFNPYAVMAVNPRRHPYVNYAGASALIDWLASAEAQTLIKDYTVDGERLFHPLLLEKP